MSVAVTKENWYTVLYTTDDSDKDIRKRRFNCKYCAKSWKYRLDSMLRNSAELCTGLVHRDQMNAVLAIYRQRQAYMSTSNQFKLNKLRRKAKKRKRTRRDANYGRDSDSDYGRETKSSRHSQSQSQQSQSQSVLDSTLTVSSVGYTTELSSDGVEGVSVSMSPLPDIPKRQLTLCDMKAMSAQHIAQWKRLYARALILGGRPNAMADDPYMRRALEHLSFGALHKGVHLSRNSVFEDYMPRLLAQFKIEWLR